MNINVSEIINNKLMEIEKEHTVERLLEENIEKAINSAIESALDSYSIRRTIEEKLENQISQNLGELDFSSYNSFIAEKMKKIVEETCKSDVAEKIEKTFNDILVVKRENIKLSEIIEKYREWLCEYVDESEKYDLENFYINWEESDYGWITIRMSKEDYNRSLYDETAIEFTIYKKRENEQIGYLGLVYINGKSLKETLKLSNLTDIESLIVNLYYNKTSIEIDIDEYEIDNSFDIDI